MAIEELFTSAMVAILAHKDFDSWSQEHPLDGSVNKSIVWSCAMVATGKEE